VQQQVASGSKPCSFRAHRTAANREASPIPTTTNTTQINHRSQDMGWVEIKERYLRPYYLQGSFLLGTLTLGLRTGAMNYIFVDDVSLMVLLLWGSGGAEGFLGVLGHAQNCCTGGGVFAQRLCLEPLEQHAAEELDSPSNSLLFSDDDCAPVPETQSLMHTRQPVGYLGTAVVTGLLCTAVVWILFDFTDTPGGGELSVCLVGREARLCIRRGTLRYAALRSAYLLAVTQGMLNAHRSQPNTLGNRQRRQQLQHPQGFVNT